MGNRTARVHGGLFSEYFQAVLRHRCFKAFWMLMACGLFRLQAVSLPQSPRAYTQRIWNSDDGLPDNRITCLKRTRDGYLWIGTECGLARFDGSRFNTFTADKTLLFRRQGGDFITALEEGPDGALWVATRAGFLRLFQNEFTRFEGPGVPLMQGRKAVLTAGLDGALWMLYGGECLRVEGGRVTWHRNINLLERVLAARGLEDGSLEVVSDQAWMTLHRQGPDVVTNLVREVSAPVWICARVAPEGRVQLGTGTALALVSAGTTPRWMPAAADGTPLVWLSGGSQGRDWCQLENQPPCEQMQGRSVQIDKTRLWDGGRVSSMAVDAEGNVWFGSEEGLYQFSPQLVKSFIPANHLVESQVQAVCEDNAGNVWAAGQKGLSCLSPGTPAFIPVEGARSASVNRCLWPAPGGGVLLGTKQGSVFQVRSGEVSQLVSPGQVPGWLHSLVTDSSGQLWMGINTGLLRCGMESLNITNLSGIFKPVPFIRCFCEDHQGTLWMGTALGLYSLKSGQLTHYTPTNGLAGLFVQALLEDPKGSLWCVTPKGLTRISKGVCSAVIPIGQIPEKNINSMLLDDLGNIWFGSPHGLHFAPLSELEAFSEGRVSAIKFVTLDSSDGMGSSETSGSQSGPASWKGRDGRLWFATARGVTQVDLGLIQESMPLLTNAPVAIIQGVWDSGQMVGGEVIPRRAIANGAIPGKPGLFSDNTSLLPAGKHNFEFSYTAPSFLNNKGLIFRYRLLGHDPVWRRVAGEERRIRFAGLAPGDYRFEVEAFNSHGVLSAKPAAFSFRLAPHLWQLFWFQGLCVAAGGAFIWGLQALRMRSFRKLSGLERERGLELERSRIARDLHDDLGTELAGLALQLDILQRSANADGWNGAGQLKLSAEILRNQVSRTRELVWSVNPKCDSVLSLADFLQEKSERYLRPSGVVLHFEFPIVIPDLPLTAQPRYQLALCVREALTNILRHARAAEVRLGFALVDGRLRVWIEDDGVGFDPLVPARGGLLNMRARMKGVGGSCNVQSWLGKGTLLTFELPIDHEQRDKTN